MSILRFPCGCAVKKKDNIDDNVVIDYSSPDQLTGLDIDIYKINTNCQATWDLISSGQTKGMFQIESPLGRDWSKRIRPNTISELSDVISVIRPGTLNAYSGDPPKSMTTRYCDRKNKMEDIPKYNPVYDNVLKDTYNIIVYQEQCMSIAKELAGFSLEQADTLRKGIGKKKADVLFGLEKDFVEGCKNKGTVTEEQAKEIFGWIKESARYSFNKSHGCAYSKDSYWTAWIKTHLPLAFYCSWIKNAVHEAYPADEIYELVNDAKINNIMICVPDFRDIKVDTFIKEGKIYFGLGNVKGLGEKTIKRVVARIADAEKKVGKKAADWTWYEYLVSFSDTVSITVNQALILCGTLDYFHLSRTYMIYQINIWNKLTDIEKENIKKYSSGVLDKNMDVMLANKGCSNKNREKIVDGLLKMLNNPPFKLEDSAEYIAFNEAKFLGAPITCHKVDGKDIAFGYNSTCKELVLGQMGNIQLVAEIDEIKQTTTKKGKNPGQKMAMLSISDSTGAFNNTVIFPEAYSKYSDMLQEGNIVIIKGYRKTSLVISELTLI